MMSGAVQQDTDTNRGKQTQNGRHNILEKTSEDAAVSENADRSERADADQKNKRKDRAAAPRPTTTPEITGYMRAARTLLVVIVLVLIAYILYWIAVNIFHFELSFVRCVAFVLPWFM